MCCGRSRRRASRPCSQFGGTVVQCNEEGLLACFGFPVAYEDAAAAPHGPASGSSRT